MNFLVLLMQRWIMIDVWYVWRVNACELWTFCISMELFRLMPFFICVMYFMGVVVGLRHKNTKLQIPKVFFKSSNYSWFQLFKSQNFFRPTISKRNAQKKCFNLAFYSERLRHVYHVPFHRFENGDIVQTLSLSFPH